MRGLIRPLDLIARWALPPRCPGCDAIVGDDHRFCVDCWDGLRFLGPPWCAGCNTPFDHHRGPDARCAACVARPPLHAGVCAAVAYDAVSRRLALRLKYGRRVGLGETMARHMLRSMLAEIDLIVPVPLHPRRLWSRGFNQSVEIGAALARLGGTRLDRSALIRTRATPALKGRGHHARARAVRGAFAVPDPARVAGLRLALVDDVYTSGATTDAATRALLRAGAASVTVLCWARVLGDPND